MSTTSQDTASLIAATVEQTAISMAPIVIQAAANGAMSTTPQGAALSIGAAILTAMIQAKTATASDMEAFVKQMAPSIIAGQAAIDAAAAARGVTDPTTAPPVGVIATGTPA